jgi:hypothetical protein
MAEGEIIKRDSKDYLDLGTGQMAEISGYKDGVPVLKAITTSKQDGFDTQGNPKVSVQVSVPCVAIGAIPGKNG